MTGMPPTENVRLDGATVFIALCASGASTRSLETLLTLLPPQEDAAVAIILQHREALDEELEEIRHRAGA